MECALAPVVREARAALDQLHQARIEKIVGHNADQLREMVAIPFSVEAVMPPRLNFDG